MARVGVYWHERQNISAVSSGTQTTDWDWPDSSQESKHGSLHYNRAHAHWNRWLDILSLPKRRNNQINDVTKRSSGVLSALFYSFFVL